MTRAEAVRLMVQQPVKIGRMLGFKDLTDLHNEWLRDMICGKGDRLLQSHRGSYKTTCVSLALAEIMVLRPRLRVLFLRKTDTDVQEIVEQIRRILEDPRTVYLARVIYGVDLKFTASNRNELRTNLSEDIKGTPQLTALGTLGSLTGKHFDLIFTDDIVTLQDRASRAERERVKKIYQELHNLLNPGGRIYNTGTPWHPDDAFGLMPDPIRWDCYSTGLMDQSQIDDLRSRMEPSLFAANYELRHIPSDAVLFTRPQTGASASKLMYCDCHVDAAYGGDDYTAFTAAAYLKEKITEEVDGRKEEKTVNRCYIYGRLWQKHVDDVADQIGKLYDQFLCREIWCEDNGDKGYLGKALRQQGMRARTYHETTNKHIKITSYLKAVWPEVIFVEGTDEAYINQICDYTPDAEHDDAPDSAASLVRRLWRLSPERIPENREQRQIRSGEGIYS